MIGIYKISCCQEPLVYIGSSINIKKRWKQHEATLNCQKHHNHRLQLSWDAYGSDSFTFSVLEITTMQKLLCKEQYWIDYVGFSNLYNLSNIANNPLANSDILSKAIYTKQINGNCITEHTVQVIKELYRDTELTDKEVAAIADVSTDIAANIRQGKTWKSVFVEGFLPNKRQLSSKDVVEIKTIIRDTSLSDVEIAKKFNVSKSTINHIRLGKTWKNIEIDNFYVKKRKVAKIKRKTLYHKLTENDAVEIKQLLKDKVSPKEISKKFKVSRSTIYDIRLGRTWNHIPDQQK